MHWLALPSGYCLGLLSPSGRPVVCALLSSGVSEVVNSPGDSAVALMACAYGRLCVA